MYGHAMKRLQILIEEELDADLERLAAEQGTSKAALIRQFVRERIQPRAEQDPLWEMAGADEFLPADDIDEVVYR